MQTRAELITNKALRVGQRFEVETSEPISLDGHVVIPVGTPGVDEVATVRNKGKTAGGGCGIRLCSSPPGYP